MEPPSSSSSDSEGSTDVEDLLAASRAARTAGIDPVEAVEDQEQPVENSDLDATMNDDGDGTHGEQAQPAATAPAKQPPTASRRARMTNVRYCTLIQPTLLPRRGDQFSTTAIVPTNPFTKL